MGRGDNQTKATIQAIRAINARLPQTASAGKSTVSKFGFHTSRQPAEEGDIGGQIRTAVGTSARHRKHIKITLAPTPWDNKESD